MTINGDNKSNDKIVIVNALSFLHTFLIYALKSTCEMKKYKNTLSFLYVIYIY